VSRTILSVDDSASMRQMVALTLEGAGYTVLAACDGEDALQKLAGGRGPTSSSPTSTCPASTASA
jgi:CheY-like chemotaxis protein